MATDRSASRPPMPQETRLLRGQPDPRADGHSHSHSVSVSAFREATTGLEEDRAWAQVEPYHEVAPEKELAAKGQCYAVLKSFGPKGRRRVLQWLADVLLDANVVYDE